MDQTGREVAVKEGAGDAGARELEGCAGSPRAVREADARGTAPLTDGVTAARLARLPLDRVVVELNVEVACVNIRSVNEHNLEEVQHTHVGAVAADAGPGHAECLVSI